MLGKKTVDSALAAFKKVVADLEKVGREQDELVEDLTIDIQEAESRRSAAEAESKRAKTVIGKIENLIAL
jgi:hypothetical protein